MEAEIARNLELLSALAESNTTDISPPQRPDDLNPNVVKPEKKALPDRSR